MNPTPGGTDFALSVACPPTMWIGEEIVCVAAAEYPQLGQRDVTGFAQWSTTPVTVVAPGRASYLIVGVAVGQATVTAQFEGQRQSTTLSVVAADGLRLTSSADTAYRRGASATTTLLGYYSVASAATGRLFARFSDQNGTVSESVPTNVANGGGKVLIEHTFNIPATSTEICRSVILEIGSLTLVQPQGASQFRCLAVSP